MATHSPSECDSALPMALSLMWRKASVTIIKITFKIKKRNYRSELELEEL